MRGALQEAAEALGLPLGDVAMAARGVSEVFQASAPVSTRQLPKAGNKYIKTGH